MVDVRKRDIQRRSIGICGQQLGSPSRHGILKHALESVRSRSNGRSLFNRELPDSAKHGSQPTASSQPLDTPGLQPCFVACIGKRRTSFRL